MKKSSRYFSARGPSDSDALPATTERRRFLRKSAAGAMALSASPAVMANVPDSWTQAGSEFSNYGQPHDDEKNVIRWISQANSVPGDGVSWTPLHDLEGTITPNGLHFERHHNGIPEIDSANWQLVLHGLVKKSTFL